MLGPLAQRLARPAVWWHQKKLVLLGSARISLPSEASQIGYPAWASLMTASISFSARLNLCSSAGATAGASKPNMAM